MDRNWLIRTSQNQILGPVAKSKLLEFIQKGALGLTDEVASGNGYWFSLKERDLVEKYLYGDMPQGYNPISESKSVLARRENPDKTSSINTAPANATQVIKISSVPGLAPKNEDLEFPDVLTSSSPNPNPHATHIIKLDDHLFNSGQVSPTSAPLKTGTPVLDFNEVPVSSKLPAKDDLEFPDVNAITAQVDQSFKYPGPDGLTSVNRASNFSSVPAASPTPKKEMLADGEEIMLPGDDDLAFPDMDDHKTSTKVEKGKVDLGHQYTRTVALDGQQAAKVIPATGAKAHRDLESDFGDLSLGLDLDTAEKNVEANSPETASAPATAHLSLKKEKNSAQAVAQNHHEDKKLLHDRKTKSVTKAAQRDPTREVVYKEPAEPLKKRNDNYIFFILIILILIIVAVFFYFKEILNKPLPV